MRKLNQESGGDADSRAAEANRILFEMGVAEACGSFEDDKSNEFVQGMIDRFEKYGPKTQVSAKQLFWLRDLKDKL